MRTEQLADGSFVTTPFYCGFTLKPVPPPPCSDPSLHDWHRETKPEKVESGDAYSVREGCLKCCYLRMHFYETLEQANAAESPSTTPPGAQDG